MARQNGILRSSEMNELRVQVMTWLKPQHIMENGRCDADDFIQQVSMHKGLKWAKPNNVLFIDIYLVFIETGE